MSAFKRISLTFGCMLTILAAPMAQNTVPARQVGNISGDFIPNQVEKGLRPQWAKSIMKANADRPYIYNVKDGEADIFGQLRYQKNMKGMGLIKLTSDNPGKFEWIRDYGYIAGTTPLLTAGTYVGNEYYAFETIFYNNINMPEAICVVNTNTGEYVAKKKLVNSTTERPLILDEMTYDPKTDRIFGLNYDTDEQTSYIYEIDRTSLELKHVATIPSLIFTLAADNGCLYAMSMTARGSMLNKIEISSINAAAKTCTMTNTGVDTGVKMGDYSQSMEFDKTTHRLWWLAQTEDGGASFVELDAETGEAKSKTSLSNDLQLLAMAIPYQYVPDATPSYPRNFTVAADANGALSASLSFTTPNLNYRNGSLADLSGVKVYRNGELVQTISETSQNKAVSWTDTPTTDGYYIYKVVPFNASGDGVYKEYAAFVGEDLPGEPQNVTVSAIGANATISWAAPAAGQHGGYYDASSLKYSVVRMPDNVTIVEGTTATNITDAVAESKGYTYVVTAENNKGKGSSATSSTLSFGPQGNIPFTSSLQTQKEFDRWLVVDNNNDGGTWYFDENTNTTTYGRTENVADDWLYTPALTFDKSKTYQVRYTYWTINWVDANRVPLWEKMKVMLCQEPLNSGNQQLIYDHDEFHTASGTYFHGQENFQPEESGSARIGFQAYSDADRSFIYLKDISIREYSTSDLSAQLLTGSNEVNCNVPQTFTVDVRNEGSANVNDYKVVILNADTHVVLGESKGIAVAPNQTVEVPVEWFPSAEGKINISARVELASDTYPADNTIADPIEVTVKPENATRWLNLNVDNNVGWRYPFFLQDPYSRCQTIFLAKQMQKKGVKLTGMRLLYNGKRASKFTFPTKISFKETSRSHVLNDDATRAYFEEDGFTTVFDGEVSFSGVGDRKELIINFTTPFEYKGGNVCMDFECPLGSTVMGPEEHPDWLLYQEIGTETPHTAYCNGTSKDAALTEVYGSDFMPVVSVSYEGLGETGIFSLVGDEFAITRAGNEFCFATACDEVQLFNLAGTQVAAASKASSINVAGLSKGVYMLKVNVGGAAKTFKVTL